VTVEDAIPPAIESFGRVFDREIVFEDESEEYEDKSELVFSPKVAPMSSFGA
jgi:hypothetical protein